MSYILQEITATTLAAWLKGNNELSVIDVREQAIFAQGHLFYARCIPIATIELKIDELVPRKTVPIVLVDDGSAIVKNRGLMEEAAALLSSLGYTNLSLLAGTADDWRANGFGIHEGIHVPSKAFGEHVEHKHGTPEIDPDTLARMKAEKPSLKIVDCRPLDEFTRMSLPGAINCPGGDLLLRIDTLIETPNEPIVINCAGRTRGIIGTQTLLEAGFNNPVMALRNGTMGWELAGHPVNHGMQKQIPFPDRASIELAHDRALHWREKVGLHVTNWNQYHKMSRAYGSTVYLLDVRDPSEYHAKRLPGSVNAPAGQLIQATDTYIGVLRAQLVLFDSLGIRNTMAGYWLKEAGWDDIYLLDSGPLVTPKHFQPDRYSHLVPPENRVNMGDLRRLMAKNATLVDLSSSADYFQGHIPGAWFGLRRGLAVALAARDLDGPLVLMARNRDAACLTYRDLASVHQAPLFVFFVESASWPNFPGGLETGFKRPLSPPIDMWHTPSSPLGRGKSAMKQYISWETNLLRRTADEPGLQYTDTLQS